MEIALSEEILKPSLYLDDCGPRRSLEKPFIKDSPTNVGFNFLYYNSPCE